jgi:hypothetical protein
VVIGIFESSLNLAIATKIPGRDGIDNRHHSNMIRAGHRVFRGEKGHRSGEGITRVTAEFSLDGIG